MTDGYLLGVDIGTYESKGVITDVAGQVIGSAVSPHTLIIPRQGWAEHDAEAVWWGDFVFITQQLLAETGVPARQIRGVGVSAIAPALLPVDRAGKPLRRGGILYGVDTRAVDEIAYLNETIGPDRIFQRCGNALSAQAYGPKILWLKRHEPDVYRAAHQFVTATTFIVSRLTGQYCIDQVTASTALPLYDIHRQAYTTDLTDEIVALERLPEIVWSDQVVGAVSGEAARLTGLAEGTPVVVGTDDAAAEALSVGVTAPGQMMLMYGSTVFFINILDRTLTDERLWAAPFLFRGTACLMAGMATSGSLTRWFRDQLARDLVAAEEAGLESAYSGLISEARATPPGAEGLLVLPYFSGERTPINDPGARGVIFGLTLAHSRGHLFRATLEGIGYGIRHHYEVMHEIGAAPQEIIAVGGGTRNRLWLQIVSDIMQQPQRVPQVTVGASYGDAFLAGLGAGVLRSPDEIRRWVRYSHTIEPDPTNADRYDEYMQLYLELYRRNKDLMHQLTDLA